MSNIKTRATLALSLGCAFATVGALEPLEVVSGVPPWAYRALIMAGVAGIGASVFFYIIYYCRNFWLPAVAYDVREAKRRELRKIWEFAAAELPERPSWNATKRHYARIPNGFHVIERVVEMRYWTHSSIVGFLTIVPVTADGVRELLNGVEFRESFMAPSFESSIAKGLYIGSIAARGARARGEVLGYLRATLKQLTTSGLPIVFTRPITKDGLRLALKNDYAPVDASVADMELGYIYFRRY